MPPLNIHHLQYSQSERIPWLLHELALSSPPSNIPYKITFHQRAPLLSPPALVALHPMHAAPVLEDTTASGKELMLAESGAIIEYIMSVYAPDSPLRLKAGEEGYVDFLYWWHWANSNLQPVLMRCNTFRHVDLPDDAPIKKNTMDRMHVALSHLNEHLSKDGNEWLAGKTFTIADVMIVFSLTTMRRFYGYDLSRWEGVLAYLQRIGARQGYQESMAEADAGMDWKEAMQGKPPRPFMEVRPKA
jgi:glutathione S-transferase